MLKRRWIIAIALGLGLFIQANESWSQAASENQPRQQEGAADTNDSSSEQQAQAEQFIPALENIEAAIRDLIAEEDKIEQERRERQEARDLQAQEGMAWWAELMFYATTATVALTAVALFAIVRTLHHTRRAADYTEGMLAEAKKTTLATSRAWLQVVLIEAERTPGDYPNWHVTARIQNIGNSPALAIVTNMQITNSLLTSSLDLKEHTRLAIADRERTEGNVERSLFPNEEYTNSWSLSLDDKLEPGFLGFAHPVVLICVSYKAIYGEKIHVTSVAYSIQACVDGVIENTLEPISVTAGGFAT